MELFIKHRLKYWTIVFVDFQWEKHLFDSFDNMQLIGNCLIDFGLNMKNLLKLYS